MAIIMVAVVRPFKSNHVSENDGPRIPNGACEIVAKAYAWILFSSRRLCIDDWE
jgi:hypothetical protein